MKTKMRKMQFLIEINAPRERVWNTLWEDTTFRDWASIIDEGTYMLGEMKEGNDVQFISSVSGYGVTSLVEKLNPNEFVLFRHMTDTQESGEREREKEWTGGMESYSITENGDGTTLTVELDVPHEQTETFTVRLPKALKRIKKLAENIHKEIAAGVVHKVPSDLHKVLTTTPKLRAEWNSLTPLARNEWICWIISVKKPETRKHHIERARAEILKGKRRPCCWAGCPHRRKEAGIKLIN